MGKTLDSEFLNRIRIETLFLLERKLFLPMVSLQMDESRTIELLLSKSKRGNRLSVGLQTDLSTR